MRDEIDLMTKPLPNVLLLTVCDKPVFLPRASVRGTVLPPAVYRTSGTGRTIISPFPPPVHGQTAFILMVLIVLPVLLRLFSAGRPHTRQRRFITHHCYCFPS